MKNFKKKIMGLLLLLYGIAAALVLFLLNISYIQNNKNSISRILNMKFQIVSGQSADGQQEISKEPEKNNNPETESGGTTEEKEKSYIVSAD